MACAAKGHSTFKQYTLETTQGGEIEAIAAWMLYEETTTPIKKREIYNVPCRYFVDACVVILRAVLALRPPDDTFVLVLGFRSIGSGAVLLS